MTENKEPTIKGVTNDLMLAIHAFMQDAPETFSRNDLLRKIENIPWMKDNAKADD